MGVEIISWSISYFMINLHESTGPGGLKLYFIVIRLEVWAFLYLHTFVYESSECTGETATNVSISLSNNYPLMR